MNIALTGASGFVGRALTSRLSKAGHVVQAVSTRRGLSTDALVGCDGVINLAGEPVSQRWTASVREKIIKSRVDGTRALVAAMRPHPPSVLINASAVGYYGSRGDEILTESSGPGDDFLSKVAVEWEQQAHAAESLGVRVACLRIGVVLGPGGGALAKMVPPFKLGLGGRLGDGHQWTSWIHLDDLTALIEFLLQDSSVRGAFNATSPHPVTNREFTQALAAALHRPAIIPVPAFALKLLFGEMASVILGSQRALPEAATRAGFLFEHPDVFAALSEILAT